LLNKTISGTPIDVVIDRVNYILEELKEISEEDPIEQIKKTHLYDENGEFVALELDQQDADEKFGLAERKYNRLIELKNLIISHIEGMF
jgi:RecB family endonuclease NucS